MPAYRRPRRAPSAPRARSGPSLSAPVQNTQAGNPRAGQSYRVQKAPGGSWHIYPGGKRVFVRAGTPAAPAAAAPVVAPPPATSSAASMAAVPKFAPDSDYAAWKAAAIKQMNEQFTALESEDASDEANYQENLRRLNEAEPEAIQGADESYNQQGLFYSGQLGKKRGDIRTQYVRQRADALQGRRARQRAREEARRALEAGFSVEDAAAIAAAADRQIGRDTDAADAGYLVNEAEPAAAPAAPSAAASQPRSVRIGNTNTFRAQTGPNAGQTYVIVKRGNKRYRKYSDGRYVPA